MFSQFKLKMGKSHSASGSSAGAKQSNKKDKSQPSNGLSSAATTSATTTGAKVPQQPRSSQPLPILKHSDGSRSSVAAAAAAAASSAASSISASGYAHHQHHPQPSSLGIYPPHPNVHYADQQHQQQQHPQQQHPQQQHPQQQHPQQQHPRQQHPQQQHPQQQHPQQQSYPVTSQSSSVGLTNGTHQQQMNVQPSINETLPYQPNATMSSGGGGVGYSNGVSTRLSASSTSSNLNRNGTFSTRHPLPNNLLSSSLSSNAISNSLSLSGSVSLNASQSSTMSRPQMPSVSMSGQHLVNQQQPIYMSRAQPIYGATTGGANNLQGNNNQLVRKMVAVPGQPIIPPQQSQQHHIYSQTPAQSINAIYDKTGVIYGTYKPYNVQQQQLSQQQQQQQQQQFYQQQHLAIGPLQFDPRWTRAASCLPPDEDTGIMSEAETSSTGFRRSSKIRSSLPIVRTMSKTLDRSLGLVFLQYRNETKKSLLPNEITSLDTVKALYVRSFPRQLTMNYFDDRNRVRIYIHDHQKDVFYELEDLREVKDRCILRIYEQDLHNGVWLPAGGGPQQMPVTNAIYGQTGPNGSMFSEELSYFSEPEFDVEARASTMQRKRFSTTIGGPSCYYGTVVHRPHLLMYKSNNNGTQPMNDIRQQIVSGGQMVTNGVVGSAMKYMSSQPGHSSTLPRGATLMSMSAYDSAKPQPTPPPKPQRSFAASLSASQLNHPLPGSPAAAMAAALQQNAGGRLHSLSSSTSSGIVDRALPERPYSVAGHYGYDGGRGTAMAELSASARNPMFDLRQYQVQPMTGASMDVRTQHARAAAAAAAAAVAGRQAKDGQPVALDSETQRLLQQINKYVENLAVTAENSALSNKPDKKQSDSDAINGGGALQQMKRSSKALSEEVKSLRKYVLNNRQELSAILDDARSKLRDQQSLLSLPDGGEQRLRWTRMRLSRDETSYRTEVRRLEQQLSELEASVERLRANVINRRCKVNMPEVETMALSLSRASKHLSELKASFPALQSQLKITMTKEMQVVVDEEKFLKEEPDRLENALRRCKKLTGTLVTLKRLASVQEQRSSASKGSLEKSLSTDSTDELETAKGVNMLIQVTPATPTLVNNAKPENVLDSLLDELQVFTSNKQTKSPGEQQTDKPTGSPTGGQHLPRRSLDLGKKHAPQPPPRSSSSKINEQQEQIRQLLLLQNTISTQKSLLSQRNVPPPTAPKPNVIRSNSEPCSKQQQPSSSNKTCATILSNGETTTDQDQATASSDAKVMTNGIECNGNGLQGQMMSSMSNTSLSSIDSQESVVDGTTGLRKNRQQRLEERHQELLRKQRLLQEQYTQLQQLYRGELPKNLLFNDLKKTASDSNLSQGDQKKSLINLKENQVGLNSPDIAGSCSLDATAASSPLSNGQNGCKKETDKGFSSLSDVENGPPVESSTVKMTSGQKVYRTDLL